MEPRVRRLLALPLIVAAMLCVVVALGSAQADGDGSDGDSHRNEADQTLRRFGLDYVPLRGDKADMAVRTVLLRHDGKTYALTTRRGMEVKSRHRLPLGRVPLLGQLTDPPYERSSFAAKNKIGSAFYDRRGKKLLIRIRPSVILDSAFF